MARRTTTAGRDRQDHVHPRAVGPARHVRLGADEHRGVGTLVWRHPLADVAAKAAAPIGAAFTFLCLVTGSLWGRPLWGTYWVWDARLTSVLILFLMYLGVIALWRTVEDPSRAARAAAILTLVGAINLPIIRFP
jgi:heme exporter protein C